LKKKLKPRIPNLEEISLLHSLFRRYLEKDMTYANMVFALYKADTAKFQKAFGIVFGEMCPVIEQEFVARLLLQTGLKVTKLMEYHHLVRSRDAVE
jgi:hypothetical protein